MDRGQSQGKRKRAEEESIEGASTSSFISLEATTVDSDQYDVFLSFRGLDTRYSFTDCLYHSLLEAGTVPFGVFRDDNSISIGKKFGSKILDAITQSKISIPIISENYASSKWCLRELTHIMERKKSTSHIVLPVFYKVTPSDVRHLTGNFGNAFHLSREHFDEKDIHEGEQALRDVSNLHGWESEKVANRHEGELIKLVVRTVLSELQKDFQLVVPRQLVGLDGQLKKIMDWILSPSVNARMIGIYGMGGIGKTTLAKCVYNKVLDKFVEASFLPDIREKATQHHGIENLQRQLISDILHSKIDVPRIDDGINIIRSRFKEKKVLILLDDIDNKKQLDALAGERNWFMAGSMIIVTTRNQAVLDQCEFEIDYKYELKEMDEVNSLLLFNIHAFRMDHSPENFKNISHAIISTMGGLPLAVQVVGSYLYKKTNQDVWEDVLKQLEKGPHKDVQKILRISYDALEDEHKQIFLHIACFLIGENSKFAMYMWEDYGFRPSLGIEELKLRCLIKIGNYDKFEMHDQLRDLGRSISYQGQSLEKRRRPWNYEGFSRLQITQERDSWFHELLGAASSRNSTELSEVRWLQWTIILGDESLWTNLHLPKLSVLELSCSDITTDWEGWSSFKASEQLKVLILAQCQFLFCTPDLSTFTQLKILILSECYELEQLDPSIGKLTCLVSLDLSFCGLEELPNEVGELINLEELLLDYSNITKIPESIGSLRKLRKLTKLSASGCKSLRKIPRSIGDLQNLQHLKLSFSEIKKLSSKIGDLPSLKILNLSMTPISDLPASVQKLSSLQRLKLRDCGELQSLPKLPSSLQSLNLDGCNKLYSPPKLPLSLKHLSVTCQSLGLSQPFRLIHLEELYLDVLNSPEDIRELCFEEWHNLTLLYLRRLTHLEKLSIKKCSSIESLGLSELIHLKQLRIEHCDSLVEIKDCDNLESLEVIFLNECKCLKKFKASRCGNLVEIQGLDGAKSLEKLDFTGCKSMETLPDLIGFEKLRSLIVQDCKKLTQLQGLEKLNLIDLDISGCDSLEPIPNLPCTRVYKNYERPPLFKFSLETLSCGDNDVLNLTPILQQ